MVTTRRRRWITATPILALLLTLSWTDAAMSDLGPLLPNDLVLSTGVVDGIAADAAFDGARYLNVWSQGDDIVGRFVDAAGAPAPAPFPIGQHATLEQYPAVVFNGTRYLVVWYDNNAGADVIRARVVGTDGSLLGTEVVVSDPGGPANAPDVASDGTGFLVVWTDGRNFGADFRDIWAQRLSVDGSGVAVLDGTNFRVSPAAGHQDYPSIAFGTTTYLVGWRHDTAPNAQQFDVIAALVSPAGVVSSPIDVSTASSIQSTRAPGIGFDGANFLVVWDDRRAGTTDLFGARVSQAGALLDGPPATGGILVSDDPGFGIPQQPTVVFGGSSWLVVWAGTLTRGARITPGGVVLDPAGLNLYVMPSAQFAPAVATDGTHFLVSWWAQATAERVAQLVGPAVTTTTSTTVTTPSTTTTTEPTTTTTAVTTSSTVTIMTTTTVATSSTVPSTTTTTSGPSTSTTSTTLSSGACGNRVIDPGETCDDGNTADGDCCSAACQLLGPDADADTVGDSCDNCPGDANPDQLSSDCSGPLTNPGCVDGGDVCDACPTDAGNVCDPAQSAGAIIGADGGVLPTPDGTVTIAIPPGALAQPTSISITETLGDIQIGPFGRALAVELGPEGQTFATPVTVTFAWADANNDGRVDGTSINEANLSVWREGVEITGRCSQTTCTAGTCTAACCKPVASGCVTACCDMAANTWTLQLTSFSEYAVEAAVPIPALSRWGWVLLVAGVLGAAIAARRVFTPGTAHLWAR